MKVMIITDTNKQAVRIASFIEGEDIIDNIVLSTVNRYTTYLYSEFYDVVFLYTKGDLEAVIKNILDIHRRTNIIVLSEDYSWAAQCLELFVSGYVVEPFTSEKIMEQFHHLRYDNRPNEKSPLYVKCLGNFEVLNEGKVVSFKYSKTKELVAYLYHRKNTLCSNGEIMSILWEDDSKTNYLKQLKKDLKDTFSAIHKDYIIMQRRNGIGLDARFINSDLNYCLNGEEPFKGEYMCQYSWAESYNAYLENNY